MHFQAIPVLKSLPRTVWETYSAFANTFGGTIVLGASLRKNGVLHITGIDNPDRILRDFWSTIRDTGKVSSALVKQKDVRIESAGDMKIIVIDVPRAERGFCPVYIEDSLYSGTFLRTENGDRYCNSSEIASMLRNNNDDITDLDPVESMEIDVLNMNTVDIFRAHLKATNPRHPWVDLPLEEFLYVIGAGTQRINGVYHPTKAGLLMFGNEYSIVKIFPSYYLEYYEGDIVEGEISDRVVSSSGEWSGNVFDFYLLITDRMLAIPNEMKKDRSVMNDIDSSLNDILLVSLTDADYEGKRGVAVEKTKDSVKISVPGLFRTPVERMVVSGYEGPRNKGIARMLSLVDLFHGNRSVYKELSDKWKENGFPAPMFEESMEPPSSSILMMLDYQSMVIATEKGTNADILRALKSDEHASAGSIAASLNISTRHVERILAELKEKGKITREGNRRSGTWKII